MRKVLIELKNLIKKQFKKEKSSYVVATLAILLVLGTAYVFMSPAFTINTDDSSSMVETPSESTDEKVQSSTVADSSTINDSSRVTEQSTEASKEDTEEFKSSGTLNAETSDVTVNIDYEDGTFSEAVDLKVTPVTETTAIDQKLTSYLANKKQKLVQTRTYNITFLNKNGDEVEPSKDVKVSMNFKSNIQSSSVPSDWKFYHFAGNNLDNVEDLTSKKDTTITQDSSDSLTNVEFTSNQFSEYTIADVTYADFAPFLTGYSYDESSVKEDLSTEELTVALELNFKINTDNFIDDKNYCLALPEGANLSHNIELNKEYTGTTGSGSDKKEAFKYKFLQDGGRYYLAISFLDDYIEGLDPGEDALGNIEYTAVYGTSFKDESGNYNISYSSDLTVEIPADDVTKNYDLTTTKKGTASYEEDTAYANYTVTVDSKYGTPGEINLNDTLTASGISIDSVDQVSVIYSTYVGDTSNVTATEAVNIAPNFDTANKTWSMTLPQMVSGGVNADGKPIGHFYTINYRYKIADLAPGREVQLLNKINATSSGDKYNLTPSDSEVINLKLNDITKSGNYDSTTGLINWTIVVNSNGNDIAGATLSDDNFSKASNLTLSPDGEGYTIERDSNDKVSHIKFNAISNGVNTKSYTITYTTPATNSKWDATKIKNTAYLDDDGDKTTTTDRSKDSAEVTVPGDGNLVKEFVSEDDTSDSDVKALTWKATITMPDDDKLVSGTKFKDVLHQGSDSSRDSTIHWYTKAQLQELYEHLTAAFGADTFTLKAKVQESDGYTDYSALDNNAKYTEFMITLTSDVSSSEDISFQYSSSAKLNGGSTVDFDNEISSDSHDSKVNHTYVDTSNVIKMDGNENQATSIVNSEDGTVTWKVKIRLTDDIQSMTVTDTLPSNVNLVGFSYGQHTSQIAATISGSSISAGSDTADVSNIALDGNISSDKVVTLNFSTTNGQSLKNNIGNQDEFWLTFTTFCTEIPETGSTKAVSLTNNVTVTVDGHEYGSDSQKQNVTIGKASSEPITKSGSWNNDERRLHYSIAINPTAADLLADSDDLTLTDVMNFGNAPGISDIGLIQNSVKLYDNATGMEVPFSEWSWTYNMEKSLHVSGRYYVYIGTLTVNLKDKKAYTLVYDYKVSKENPNETGRYNPTNRATLSGVASGTSDFNTPIRWLEISTSGSVDAEKTYTIYKVDSKNNNLALAGATFTVYKYDDDGDDSNDEEITSYTTDANGQINIRKSNLPDTFTEGNYYYFKETSAPSGYKLPSDHPKYYFYYDPDQTMEPEADGITDATNLAISDNSKFIKNEEEKVETTDITVDKKWFTASGDEYDSADGSITYDLHQVATPEGGGTSTDSVLQSDITLSHENGWTKTHKDLPLTGKEGETTVNYTYYVVEHEVPGFTATYANDAGTSEVASNVATSSGTLTIKNTAQEAYVLPETGGLGTLLQYLFGILATIVGLGLLIFKVNRYRRKGGQI